MKVMVWGHLEIKVAVCTYPSELASFTHNEGHGVRSRGNQSSSVYLSLRASFTHNEGQGVRVWG